MAERNPVPDAWEAWNVWYRTLEIERPLPPLERLQHLYISGDLSVEEFEDLTERRLRREEP